MEYNFEYVNFTDTQTNKLSLQDEYDDTTTEKYRIMRLYKVDPIINEEIQKNLIFEFKYKWNPITGIRTEIDEYGSLCFNALNLYQYFYSNRYNGLWYPPKDNYQGYYGDLLGCGNDIFINGRPCPEKYLYRLPIIDCYLKKTHNHSIITMGPILTDDEINQIDNIINNQKKNKPSLKVLKEYYDQALNNSPDITELKKLNPNLTDRELKDKYNRMYVDKLINMKNY
jgi:hypothetical protein